MGYYMAGDYYVGDPGIFGFLGKLAKKAAGSVIGYVPGIGPAVTAAGILSRQPPRGGRPTRGIVGAVQRAVPGGASGYQKRRSMNMANPKALRRAMRRTDGFVKLAKRALKGSKYQVVTRGSRSSGRARSRCR